MLPLACGLVKAKFQLAGTDLVSEEPGRKGREPERQLST